MRLTKSGKRNRQDLNIQDFPHVDADPSQMLWWETRHYLAMLDKWGCGSRDVGRARAAVKNLFERLGESS